MKLCWGFNNVRRLCVGCKYSLGLYKVTLETGELCPEEPHMTPRTHFDPSLKQILSDSDVEFWIRELLLLRSKKLFCFQMLRKFWARWSVLGRADESGAASVNHTAVLVFITCCRVRQRRASHPKLPFLHGFDADKRPCSWMLFTFVYLFVFKKSYNWMFCPEQFWLNSLPICVSLLIYQEIGTIFRQSRSTGFCQN